MGAKPIAFDPMLDYWLRMMVGRSRSSAVQEFYFSPGLQGYKQVFR